MGAIDRAGSGVEGVEDPQVVKPSPPPDRPGGEGFPSRFDSIRAASSTGAARRDGEQDTPDSDETAGTSADDGPGLSGSGEAVGEHGGQATGRDGRETIGQAGESRVEDDAEIDRRRAISGEGLSDDNARIGELDDAVERGLLDRLKQAVSRTDRTDRPGELSGTVHRPDFQDPYESSGLIPARYDIPLDRADGTRTPLFDGEPTREQTKQGDLGDCGVIAALGAVAGHRPEAIRDCVRETGDGNYEVRLHEAEYSTRNLRYEPTGRLITLTVTPDLPVHDDTPGKPAFADSTSTNAAWAPVLEKAIAGVDQTWDGERLRKWSDRWDVQGRGGDPPTGYVRLNQGSNASERAELLTQLTGKPARTWEFPTTSDHRGRSADRQLLDEFRAHLADRKPILVGTRDRRPGEEEMPHNLQHCHAYEITEVDSAGKIHLRNPWNQEHPNPITVNELRATIRSRYTTLEHK